MLLVIRLMQSGVRTDFSTNMIGGCGILLVLAVVIVVGHAIATR